MFLDNEKPPQSDVYVTGTVGGENKKLKLIILVASFGLILFIVITLTFSFKEPIFNALFPKPQSLADNLKSPPPASTSTPLSSPIATSSATPVSTNNKAAPNFEGAKKVFVTSTLYDGNLGGLSGADQKCDLRAKSLNFAGIFKAWLSDSKTSAQSRLTHFNGPYKIMDGTIIADNYTDLTDGVLKAPISLDEYGFPVSWSVWTNTKENGNLATVDDCVGWTSNISYLGRVGSTTFSDLRWSSYSTSTCNYTRRLYCIEQ